MEYKKLEGFFGYYASSEGVIYSTRKSGFRPLKPKLRRDGYHEVCLYKDRKQHYRMVHRLIAAAFIENAEEKPCVNHKNGVKTDNRLVNLEWVTYSENTAHAFETGLITRIGEQSAFCLITEEQARECCRLLQDTDTTIVQIAEMLGIGKDAVSKIRRKESWKHISKDYVFRPVRDVSCRLSDEEVIVIYEMIQNGKRPSHIAKDFGVDRNVVNRIKFGQSYQEIIQNYLHKAPKTIESTSNDGSE